MRKALDFMTPGAKTPKEEDKSENKDPPKEEDESENKDPSSKKNDPLSSDFKKNDQNEEVTSLTAVELTKAICVAVMKGQAAEATLSLIHI